MPGKYLPESFTPASRLKSDSIKSPITAAVLRMIPSATACFQFMPVSLAPERRAKNTLATVQAIAAQTFRGSANGPSLLEAFEARLIALSNAHTILTQSNWEGADIRDIGPERREQGTPARCA